MEPRHKFLAAHVCAFLLHGACALYAFSTPHAYTTHIPVDLTRVRYDGCEVYYEVTSTFVFSIPSVILLHGTVALITVLFHGLVYVPAHYYYAETIWSQGFFPVRWVEYAITCTLMTISSIASSGTRDFTFILSTICLGVGLQGIGAAIEQRKELAYLLFAVGCTMYLANSVGTLWYNVSSSGATAPQVIELLSYTFYYSLFPLNCVTDAMYRRSFVRTDWAYIVLSLTSKFGLFWLQVGEVEQKVANGWWPNFQIYALGMACPLLLLSVGLYNTPDVEVGSAMQSKETILRRLCTFRVFPLQVVSVPQSDATHARPRALTGLRV